MKESQLYEPVKRLLMGIMGCEKVYAEVLTYDVVGTGNHLNIIVEMKTSLTFKVIDQAVRAKRHGHYVFIAIPEKKGGIPLVVRDFLKFHGIGMIVVPSSSMAKVVSGLFPRYNRKVDDVRKYIKDGYHDTIPGGSKMGDYDYQSEYTLMIDDIKDFLRRRRRGKWVTVDDILDHCECYYSRPKPQLSQTLKAHWNADWLEWKVENRKTHFRLRQPELPQRHA